MPGAVAASRRAVLAALAAGCTPRPPSGGAPRGPATAQVFVVQRDWHTDIGLRTPDMDGPLAALAARWPGAQSLVLGFGERGYLLSRNRSFADMAMALLPGPGAMLVTGLSVPPDGAFPADTVALGVDAAGMARLRRYLGESFAWDDGTPQRLAPGPYAGAEFYASPRRYSAAFTCNTWTAAALAEAGLPIRAEGVLFAGQVMGQVRAIAAAG